MTAEWSKVRPELENVSLNVYNKVLGKDLNYTPDSFSLLKDQKGLLIKKLETHNSKVLLKDFMTKKLVC